MKQGDALSPTLFAVYINDLANQIKPLNCGVNCGNEQISILLYADDIVLLAETELDLQKMLTCANNWCKKWRLSINEKKTEIMHFKNPAMRTSDFQFGESKLNYTKYYKCLGFYLDEHMNFIKGTSILTESANRALGGVIAKTKVLRDLGFSTYSKLYQACVCPVLDYVAGVWGFKQYPKSEAVHNRAMRYFLGIHKFTPTLAIMGDMGWEPNEVRWSMHMVRLWNRILGLNSNRIVRKIFEWDILIRGAWATDMYDILLRAGYEDHYYNKEKVESMIIKEILFQNVKDRWALDILCKPKLRTYCEIKHVYGPEDYFLYNLPKKKRSLCAQIRAGILGLHIETGRYVGTPEEDRLCGMCDLNEIENEMHFVFYCPFYNSVRKIPFDKVDPNYEFVWLEDYEKLKRLFQHEIFSFAAFLEKAWAMRRRAIYM